MSVWTLCCFLFGSRDAIEKVADTKAAVWLGLLFVFSAAFAREYDGEDLLAEPWHLGIPLVASLGTSFLLFVLICVAGGLSHWRIGPFLNEYRRFLGLYWMTAPLAWLYAIPVERWMSAAGAMEANLWLLGLVALWRVVLMIRIVSVLYSNVYVAKWMNALFIVMFFADSVFLQLLRLAPLPLISMMGGVRLSESEQLLVSVSCFTNLLGMLSLPLWLIGALVAIWKFRFQPYVEQERNERPVVRYSAWTLGILALLVWIPILPKTQPEQQLRHAVEHDLKNGQIERALATMSEHERTDFPPHWDPPPRVGYGENEPPLLDVLDVVIENETSGWVRQEYERKFEKLLGDGDYSWLFWIELDNAEFDRYLNVMEHLPLSPEILEDHRGSLLSHVSDAQRTDEQIARLHRLLGMPDVEESSGDDAIELEIGPDLEP